jgi:hypothetical protein
MVRRAYRQRSLVEVLLPDADKLWDPTLRRINALLEDEVLASRRPWPSAIRRVSAGADWGRPPRWSCDCWFSSISTTGASMSASGRCGGAWSAAPSAGSTASASRTPRSSGRRGPGAHPQPAADRGAGARAHVQCGPPVFEIAQRSRTVGSRVGPAVRERSKARMKDPLPGPDGDHARGSAPSRSRGSAGARRAAHGAPARDDRASPAGPGANAGPPAPGQYALPGQGDEPVRAAHRDHPQGQAGQAHPAARQSVQWMEEMQK